MALLFPTNPSLNDTYQSGSSATYKYNGSYWEVVTPGTQVLLTSTSSSYAVTASMVPYVYSASYATNGSTTTSTSFVDVPGAGLTLPSEGVYRIYYNMSAYNSTSAQSVTFVITDSANNLISGSAGSVKETSGTTLGNMTSTDIVLAVTSSRALKVRWKVTANTGTIVNNSSVANSVFGYEKKQ